jgi:exosome complex RNA-binding protein Rrp42 (RNase PH superfamily)
MAGTSRDIPEVKNLISHVLRNIGAKVIPDPLLDDDECLDISCVVTDTEDDGSILVVGGKRYRPIKLAYQ